MMPRDLSKRLALPLSVVLLLASAHCATVPYDAEPIPGDEPAPRKKPRDAGSSPVDFDAGFPPIPWDGALPSDGAVPFDGGAALDGAAKPQHQHANLQLHWTWGSSLRWSVDTKITVRKRAASTFFATSVTFGGTPEGAYLGLQTDGVRFDGSTGDTAIFSIWNATAATGSGCGVFAGEGTGWSCRIPYSFSTDKTYILRLWRLDAAPGGQWWGAWILDSGGLEVPIGAILAPASAIGVATTSSFAEYFGPAVGCDDVPPSAVLFGRPAANRFGLGYEQTAVFDKATRGACTGGGATPEGTGIALTFGGAR